MVGVRLRDENLQRITPSRSIPLRLGVSVKKSEGKRVFYRGKMMKKRTLIWLSGLFLLMILIAGCGEKSGKGLAGDREGTEGEPVTIRFAWWGDQVRNDRNRNLQCISVILFYCGNTSVNHFPAAIAGIMRLKSQNVERFSIPVHEYRIHISSFAVCFGISFCFPFY